MIKKKLKRNLQDSQEAVIVFVKCIWAQIKRKSGRIVFGGLAKNNSSILQEKY